MRRVLLVAYAILVLLLLVLPLARFFLGQLDFTGLAARVLAFLLILALHWLFARPALRSPAPLTWRAAPFLWLGLPLLLVLAWEFVTQAG